MGTVTRLFANRPNFGTALAEQSRPPWVFVAVRGDEGSLTFLISAWSDKHKKLARNQTFYMASQIPSGDVVEAAAQWEMARALHELLSFMGVDWDGKPTGALRLA